MRVLFIHGMESSPQGDKARYLGARFTSLTPKMNTGDFLGCLELQAKAIASFAPDLVVGSSFGGALAVRLLNDGSWTGPTLLLAQAALKVDPNLSLPEGLPVLLVHGTQDEVIPIEDSRRLARTGSPERVRLIEVEDGHRLHSLLQGDTLAQLIEQAARM